MAEASTEAHAITPHQARLSHPATEHRQRRHPEQRAEHRPPQGLHSEQAILQQVDRPPEEALQHTGNRQQDQLRVLRNHPVLLTTEAPQEAQATLLVLAAATTEAHREEVSAEEDIAVEAIAVEAAMAVADIAEAVQVAEDNTQRS